MRTLLFPLHGFMNWNGGIDLARVLSTAITHPCISNQFNVIFAMPQQSAAESIIAGALRHWRLRLASAARHGGYGDAKFLRRAAEEVVADHAAIPCSSKASGITHAAAASGADVVFPTFLPLGAARTPRVGYLFDFQHRHMPALFSTRTRANRDERFARIAADANALVVASRATAEDAIRFLGVSPRRLLTIPYSPHALRQWFAVEPADAQQRYGTGDNYLLICNHFWKHKDHACALRGFALLCEAERDISLVLTGDPVDHRDPRHYSRLQALVDELHIAQRVRFLGLIPKRDQLALMRGCRLLIQPTLFEGGPGGGSVYEAIGLGVPSVVSDIPVNLEIDQGEVSFFRAGDAEDLAAKVAAALASANPRPGQASLLSRGDTNLVRLGSAICDYLAHLPRGRP